jgi:hypothetical protein
LAWNREDRSRVTVLALSVADEAWRIECPDRWRERFETVFSHLEDRDSGACAVAVESEYDQSRNAAWREARRHSVPADDHVVFLSNGTTISHLSCMALDEYDTACASGRSLLHDPAFEESYLGTNLLLRHFAWRARQRGLVPLHAAALMAGDDVWLIPAGGGRGKSTLTAAALAAGLDVLGDDFVLLNPATSTVHALYATIRLSPAGLDLIERNFGRDHFAFVAVRPDDKAVLRPRQEHGSGSVRRAGTLRGVLVPERAATASLGPQLPPSQALAAFASTLRLLPSLGVSAGFAFCELARLVRSTEARTFRVSPDLADSIRCLRGADGR